MKSYLACFAVFLVACAGEAGPAGSSQEIAPGQPEVSLPPSDGDYATPCDRPLQYREAVVDGQSVRVPIFVACNSAPERDHGDPPPDLLEGETRSRPSQERSAEQKARSASR